MNTIDLQHRRAIVTGGARGVGREIIRRLLDSGADVVVWGAPVDLGHNVSTLNGAKGVAVDLSDPEAVGAAVIQTLRSMGGVDILINNTGGFGRCRRVWECGPDDWSAIIGDHLSGVFHTCRAIVPHMRDAGYGRIVNVVSVDGKSGVAAGGAYAAASAGVIALGKSLAMEVADMDIMVNSITSTLARTSRFDDLSAESITELRNRIPLNRFVEPEEVAALVAWLSSAECSYTTGQVVDISGGQAGH